MLWNNLSFNVLCSGGWRGGWVVVQTFRRVRSNAFGLLSLISSLFGLIVRADVIVMNQAKSIFFFGFVFENDQLS